MDDLRDLLTPDPREAFLTGELDGFELREISRENELVCILCESGYHDHAWEVTHVMQCGCPCHAKRAIGAGENR